MNREIQVNSRLNYTIKIIHASAVCPDSYTFLKCDKISGLAKGLSVSGGI